MKYKLLTALILSFLGGNELKAQTPSLPTVHIDCSDGTCLPDFTVNSQATRNDYNAIDVGENAANIEVTVRPDAAPRSLRLNVVNGPFPDGTPSNPGVNLDVNLSSSNQQSDAGSFVLIGDNFNNLRVKLNGHNGAPGRSAAQICAANIKANLYGADALSFFNNFRLNNPSVSYDECVLDDLNYLQASKFECDSGFTEVITTNSVYSVNVHRLQKVNRCQTSLSYDVCLRRKKEISCTWDIYTGKTTFTGTATANSYVITEVSSFVGLQENQEIFAAPVIPKGTKIVSINSATGQITLSNPANTNYISLNIEAAMIKDHSTVIKRVVPENRFDYWRNMLSDEDLCEKHVATDISDPTYVPVGAVNPLTSNPDIEGACTPGTCFWRLSKLTDVFTSPGMQGDQLAEGSDWEMESLAPGQRCNTSTESANGFWTTFKTVTVNYVAYDVKDALCKATDIVTFNGGSINPNYPAQDLDPNKQAVWVYTGVAQEPDFGTEVVQCDLGNCPVDSVTSDLTKRIDLIRPEDGERGTKQGTGLLLIYDAKNIETESNIGVAGEGGRNDIIEQASTRVCVKIRDAQSDGLGSDYSRNPLVNFNRYSWSAIKTNGSGNPGQQPVNPGGGITYWKKLDSSVRAFIQNYLFER